MRREVDAVESSITWTVAVNHYADEQFVREWRNGRARLREFESVPVERSIEFGPKRTTLIA